jgi:hypothetical protein
MNAESVQTALTSIVLGLLSGLWFESLLELIVGLIVGLWFGLLLGLWFEVVGFVLGVPCFVSVCSPLDSDSH